MTKPIDIITKAMKDIGDATNTAVNASAAVICTGTSVTSAGGLLATGTITFSATYFV